MTQAKEVDYMTMPMMHAGKFQKQADESMKTLKLLKESDPEDNFYSGWLAYLFEALDAELGEEELKHVAAIIAERLERGRW